MNNLKENTKKVDHNSDFKRYLESLTETKAKDYSWTKGGEWKQRYSKLYSSKGYSLQKEPVKEPTRISFMSNDDTPHAGVLARLYSDMTADKNTTVETPTVECSSTSVLSPRSDLYCSTEVSLLKDKRRHDTELLDLVRARQRELAEEIIDKPLDLPKEDPEEEDEPSETCVHGISLRTTDRSISRSRVSRMSTRRDMDIQSILAYTTTCPAPTHLEIPAFQKLKTDSEQEVIPRWSIRRSMCPVCSQKWKDRRSINIIKNSGLKKNSSSDFPTVIAPARLRSSITLGYVPRPALAAVDEDAGVSTGGMKNTSATWQLIRARRFRIPKPQMPPPEVLVPCTSTTPLERNKDLDQRVNEFLKDELIKPFLRPDPESQDFDAIM